MSSTTAAPRRLPLQPCLLESRSVPKVWGGNSIARLLGVPTPSAEPIGESWLLFDRPDGSSPLRGSSHTVRDLMKRDARALLGDGVRPGHGGAFPLLLKILDARYVLSVQVHPDDEQARPDGDGGKMEACVVLQTGPKARFVRGLRPGVTREQFFATAHTAAVEELLLSFTPKPGDCVEIPPGTVHAMGPDVLAFEVQQNSDLTYRMYDWGRPRPVQVDKALAVTRHDADGELVASPVKAAIELGDGGRLLTHNEHFRLRRYDVRTTHALATNGRFVTLTVVAGRGMIGWRSGGVEQPVRVQAGDTMLVPACVNAVFVSPFGRLDVLVCDPGDG